MKMYITNSVDFGIDKAPGGITGKDSCNLADYNELQCQLYRVFNNSRFDQGGRFYGAYYQRLNSKERSLILINNNPTIEIDYSSFHAKMLYHINNIEYQGDPYNIYDGNLILRSAVKLLFNIALNCKSRRSAISAFRDKIVNRTKGQKGYESHNSIVSEMQLLNISYKNMYDKIIQTHPIMDSFLGKNYGVILQNKDSMIAADIIWHFTKQRIPCLCIHDSFIVEKQHGNELRSIMHSTYRSHMNGFDCETSTK